MKNVQNFLHLYDNNRLIIIGLNEMLPGHHNRVFRSFLLRKFMWTTLEIVLKFQPKVFPLSNDTCSKGPSLKYPSSKYFPSTADSLPNSSPRTSRRRSWYP